ncbi:S1C family serine protease [Methylovirgula sp. 4M-Z18]|uniref:S1C family serine protease n=1 Tax=Methylovirgula sp. 4M-Z18 TaxID=2293567 RepID=UPI001AECD8D9|nr:serine protease [Methylovirgula sp. 4M-Z18]
MYKNMLAALSKDKVEVVAKWIDSKGTIFTVDAVADDGRAVRIYEFQYQDGALLEVVSFDARDFQLEGIRLHTLMTNVLLSSTERNPWITDIPRPFNVSQSHQTTDRPKDGASSGGVITGTGIFVTSEGHVLTNAHVVKDCKGDIQIRAAAGAATGQVLASDKVNDLAVLKTSLKPAQIAKFRANARLGESVAAFGYPLSDLLATSGNFTLGNITAVAGLGDDSRYYQVSAPVQPGNSGGPLMDASGDLIGVVAAKLDALDVMQNESNGDIPQNVNFAIKAAVAQTFLSGNNINVQTGTSGAALQPADLADAAKAVAVFVSCKN